MYAIDPADQNICSGDSGGAKVGGGRAMAAVVATQLVWARGLGLSNGNLGAFEVRTLMHNGRVEADPDAPFGIRMPPGRELQRPVLVALLLRRLRLQFNMAMYRM